MNDQPTKTQLEERRGALFGVLDRLLPIVDGIADGFRFATLLGLGLVIWVFVWMFRFHHFGLAAASFVAVALAVPVLMLLRFWWGMEGLKRLPTIVAGALDNVGDEVRERAQAARSSGKVGMVRSVWRLRELRGLVGEARGILGSYLRVGTLLNPLSLFLGVLSLCWVAGLSLLGMVLLGLEAW